MITWSTHRFKFHGAQDGLDRKKMLVEYIDVRLIWMISWLT